MSFIGIALGAIALSVSANQWGKKKVYLTSLTIGVISHLVLYVFPTYKMSLLFLFLLGISVFGRLTTGYVLALDMISKTHQKTLGTVAFSLESFTIFLYGFYYYLGGKNAIFFVVMSLGFVTVALLIGFLLPESPVELFIQKRWRELKSTLEYM